MCNTFTANILNQLYGKVMIVSQPFLLTITVSLPSGDSMRIHRESYRDVLVHVVLSSILTHLLLVRGGCTSSPAVSSARLTSVSDSHKLADVHTYVRTTFSTYHSLCWTYCTNHAALQLISVTPVPRSATFRPRSAPSVFCNTRSARLHPIFGPLCSVFRSAPMPWSSQSQNAPLQPGILIHFLRPRPMYEINRDRY